MVNGKLWFPHDLDKVKEDNNLPQKVSISESQMIAAKKIEDNSPYFHDFTKGCEVEETTKLAKGSTKNHIKILLCKTHKVECHMGGWERGHWMGTDSKNLKTGQIIYEHDMKCKYCGQNFISYRANAKFCKDHKEQKNRPVQK